MHESNIGYASNVVATGTQYGPGVTLTGVQSRPKEVPAKMELIDKLLHELAEESLGLNGTFVTVLAPSLPAAGSADAQKSQFATGIGEALDGFAIRLQQSISTLRDVRSRCEL